MTKKKLNNLIHFILYILPIILLIMCMFLPSNKSYTYDTNNNLLSEDITYNISTYFMSINNGMHSVPLYNIIVNCFNIITAPNTTFSGSLVGQFVIGYIVYVIMVTFAIILKELFMLIIHIFNEHIIFKD